MAHRLLTLALATVGMCWTATCTAQSERSPTDVPPRSAAEGEAAVPDLRTRTTGSDWPCFLGPTQNSKSQETGIRTDWPRAGLPIVWIRKLATGYAMPSISMGRLFEFARDGDQAILSCLKSETGELLWQFRYPTDYVDQYGYNNGPRAQPTVDGDRVYTYGAEGMLHCVGAVDGQMQWKVDTAAEFGVVQNFFGVASAPVVEGDLLIVQVGGSPPGSDRVPFDQLEGNGSGIVAFDKYTGEVKYRSTDELASYAAPVLATIGDRRWCFVFARGGLYGFDPADGTVDFHYPWRAPILECVNASTPIVIGDRVFISECYGPGSSLLKVRPGGYELVWADQERSRRKAMQTHWNTPIHLDGYIYGSSGRHTAGAELRCISLDTGEVQWSQPGMGRASLLYIDGHFVCLCEYGELLLLRANPHRFEPVAVSILEEDRSDDAPADLPRRRLLAYPAWAAPIVSHGLLYVRGRDRLVCLELIPADSAPSDAS